MKAKQMSRREFLSLAGAASGAALLAACTPKATPEAEEAPTAAPAGRETVKITMWFHDFLYVRFFKNRAFEFEEMHPEYEFTWDVIQVPAGQIADKFISALTAGAGAPDIGGVQNQVLARLFKGQFAEKGLVDLAPKIGAEMDEFICWEPYTLDGHVYGVESSACVGTYYYRKDLWEEAGIDPTAMETWDDFITVGKEMKDRGYWMAIFETTYPEPIFLNMLLTNGSGYFDEDGDVIVDNDGGIETLQLFRDLINTHQVVMGSADFWGPGVTAAIKEDTVAGMLMPDWYLDYVLKPTFPEQSGKWAAMPGFAFKTGGVRTAYTGGTGKSVFQQSKWQDLAFDLIHYGYMTHEGQVKRWTEIHYFPTMKEVWDDRRVIEDEEPYLGGHKIGKLWADLAPSLPPFHTGFHRVELMTSLGTDVMTPVVAGEKEPAVALKELGDQIRAMSKS